MEQNFSREIHEQSLTDFLLTLQTYAAWANITHHISAMPKADNASHVQVREVQRAVGFFMCKFQATIVAFTLCAVQQDITVTQKQQVHAHEILRQDHHRDANTSWASGKHPLLYQAGAFDLLSRALAKDVNEASRGLPWANPQFLEMSEFAKLLYNMGKPFRPAPVMALLVKEGPLFNYLRITVTMFST